VDVCEAREAAGHGQTTRTVRNLRTKARSRNYMKISFCGGI